MTTPTVASKSREMSLQADLEAELRQAEQDFASGDFIELTVEDIDRSLEAGEWPWSSASSK